MARFLVRIPSSLSALLLSGLLAGFPPTWAQVSTKAELTADLNAVHAQQAQVPANMALFLIPVLVDVALFHAEPTQTDL